MNHSAIDTSSLVPLIAVHRDTYRIRQRDVGSLITDDGSITITRAIGIAINGTSGDDFRPLDVPPGWWAIATDGSPLQLMIGTVAYEWRIPAGLYVYPEDGTHIEFWRGQPTTITNVEGEQIRVPAPAEFDPDAPDRPEWVTALLFWRDMQAEQRRIDAATAELDREMDT